jgi:hypothetical protein
MFLDLVTSDQIPKVVKGFEAAIAKSFEQDRQPGRIILVTGVADKAPSPSEMKRRGEMCLKIFKSLRGDLSWGLDRILDELPRFLRAELDGTPWEPEARRATWTPG